MLKYFLNSIIFILYTQNIYAQMPEPMIRVKVSDESGKGLESAAVRIFNLEGKLLDGATTNEKGMARFPNLTENKYNIKITLIGYKDISEDKVQLNLTFPYKVIMQSNVTDLKTAEVIGERQALVQTIDKRIVNVEQLAANKNGTLFDVLQQLPGVSIEPDGTISMRGSQQINVMIDGKPRALSTALLQQMPINTIESIELITNPSSKYEAEGTSGIINIITKREKRNGNFGSVSLGVQTNHKYNAQISYGTQIKKWSLFANGGIRLNEFWRMNQGTRQFYKQSEWIGFDLYSKGKESNQNGNLRAGVEYSINKSHTVFTNASMNKQNEIGKDISSYYYNALNAYSEWKNEDNTQKNNNKDMEVGHKWNMKRNKQQLISSVLISKNNSERTFDFTLDNPNDNIVRQTNNDNNAIQKLQNWQSDYTHPFGDKGMIEAGIKLTYRQYSQKNNNVSPYTTNLFNYIFNYNDEVHALYGTYANAFKKWSYKVGFRFENTFYKYSIAGNSNDNGQKRFSNLFPSAFLSYPVTKNWQWQLSYGKRINRPGFMAINPYQDINDPYSIRKGNPNLSPEYIHNFESNMLSYLPFGSLSLSAFYRRTNNAFVRYVSIDNNAVLVVQMANGSSLNNYGFDVGMNVKATETWSFNGNVSTFNAVLMQQGRSKSQLSSKINLINSWKIFKQSEMQVNFRYNSPFLTPQGKGRAFNAVDISWKQKCFNDKGILTFIVNDVFNTQTFLIRGQDEKIIYRFERKRESRIAGINFTYNFGNTEPKQNRKKNNNNDMPSGDMGF